MKDKDFLNIPEVDQPVDWCWNEIADLVDTGERRHLLKVGHYILSIVVGFGAYCSPDRLLETAHQNRSLRHYTTVEVAIFHATGDWAIVKDISPEVAKNIAPHFENGGTSTSEVAGFVNTRLLPIWINLLLKAPKTDGKISIQKEEIPDIIEHFKNVLDPFRDGQYGKGGPGTHTYFSFAD